MLTTTCRWITLAVTAACLTAPAAQAAERAAATTCDGRVATIVGRSAEADLRGTSGPDVIVTRGGRVDAGAGNDVVCVRGGPADVDAGIGNDRVLVTTGRSVQTSVVLGPGRDALRGSAGREFVTLEGDDRVSTGAGSDGASLGIGEAAFTGSVDLGPGSDTFLSANGDDVGPSARIEGGDGRDLMEIYELGREDRAADVVIDNRRHTAVQDGRTFLRGWSSFETFTAAAYIPEDGDAMFDLRFVGGPADEVLDATRAERVRATMGGGVDRVRASTLFDGTVLDGGGQRGDALVLDQRFSQVSPATLSIDLRSGETSLTGEPGLLDGPLPPPPVEATVTRFTRLSARSDDVRLIGTAKPESLRVDACTTSVAGNGGDDDLKFHALVTSTCDADFGPPRLSGGAGNDVLVGSDNADDTLVGGPGKDRGDGRAGRDSCQVERAVRCEA